MKKAIPKFISLFTALIMLPCLTSTVYASEPTEELPEHGAMPTAVSTTAAMNGVYSYDVETQEVVYHPTEEYAQSRSSREVLPQYSPASAGEEPSDLRVVTPPDGRWKITSATGRYANTVLLEIKFPGQSETWGTGWVIGPNAIATAGHCVFSYNHGWAEWIRVYPSATGGSYGSTTHATRFWAGNDYVSNQGNYNLGIHDDWGVLTTAASIGNSTGWLGIAPTNSLAEVTGLTFQTNGYPSDLDNQGLSIPNKWMYSTYGTFTSERPRYLPTMYMDLDFAGGQSGSAIYRYWNDYGYCAQAIGVGGDSQTIVVLINTWLFDFFNSFR